MLRIQVKRSTMKATQDNSLLSVLHREMICMDFYEKEPVSLYLDNLEMLEDFVSEQKQHIQLLKHPWLGKTLIINGEIQHIENYQTLYHEMLVHLPASFVPNIKNVLILGGGSLFAAYEVLKYPTVNRVVLCDHDRAVLKLMERHYGHAVLVAQDRRFLYVKKDAQEFLNLCTDTFDLIINDCFNLAHESNIAKYSLYKSLAERCTDQGVCVDIIYRHVFDRSTTISTLSYLQKEGNLALSLVVVPEYPGILHMETIWGKSPYIAQSAKYSVNDVHYSMSETDNAMFSYFSPRNLAAYLYLPPYIKTMFNL